MPSEDTQFKPGNPGGGRRKMDPEVREMLEAKTPWAAQRMIEALDAERPIVVPGGKDNPSEVRMVIDHDLRLKAAEALFNRLYGKPAQAITGEDGGAIKVDSDGVLEMLKKFAGE